jgi:hypothetical protein
MSPAAATAADEPMPAIVDTSHPQHAPEEALGLHPRVAATLIARLMPQRRTVADRTQRRTVRRTLPPTLPHRMVAELLMAAVNISSR